MLKISDAHQIIDEIKARDTAIGRDMSRWWMYENHIVTAAKIAKAIASKINGIDEDQAYVCALLHDVCRTNERHEAKFHGISGYEKLIDKDEMAARSALLHMFLWNQMQPFEKCSTMFFDNKQDYDFVADYIKNTKPTDFDLLMQLADNLSNMNGFVTIEDRAKDLAERRGIALSQEWYDSRNNLKAYFDRKTGIDIYTLFNKTNELVKTQSNKR